MSEVRRFRVRDEADAARLFAGLRRRAGLVKQPTRVVERVVYDTFDWRIFAEGTVLEHRREREAPPALVWRSTSTGEVLGQVPVEEVPRFVWQLPEAPMTDRLAQVTDVRAIVPLVTITSEIDEARLLDGDGKTVARVVLDRSATSDAGALPAVIELHPLRGYEQESAALAQLLSAQIGLEPEPDDVAVRAMRSVGLAPGSYSSKLRLRLDRSSTALDAWTAVLRALFGTMIANEAGVRGDVDTEFLHDFRVAVRRTRSVLSDAKHVLAPETRRWARGEFRWIGQITSPARDADVLVLSVPTFEEALPPERRGDLKPFQAFAEEGQRRAHADLVAALDTDRYGELVARWRHELDDGFPESRSEPDAGRPAVAVAAARIRKAHARVIEHGRAITYASHPEELHELRKIAKRLRYLLECFGSLFDPDLVAPVVRDLKGLQDVLGSYQDSHVQASVIQQYAQRMIEDRDVPANALLAMGGVVEHLDERSRTARAQFHDRFAAFDRKRVRTSIEQLADLAGATGSRG